MPYFIQGNTNNRSTPEQQMEYPDFSPWLLCYLGPGAELYIASVFSLFKEGNY